MAAELPEPAQEARSWGPIATVLLTIGIFLIGQIVGYFLLVGALVAIGGHSLDELSGSSSLLKQTKYLFLGNILVALVTLVVIAVVVRAKQRRWKFIGFGRLKPIHAIYILSGFFVYFLTYVAVQALVKVHAPHWLEQSQDVGYSTALTGMGLLPVFISLVVLAPLVEEILFRGFLYGNLRSRVGLVGATIVTSALFASPHLLGGKTTALLWIAAVDTFILSIVLCQLRERSGSLWTPIGLHALKNGLAFYALFILKVQ